MRGREGERKGEKHWCKRKTSISCFLHVRPLETEPLSRHAPQWGIEPSTFWYVGRGPTNWATPSRDITNFWNDLKLWWLRDLQQLSKPSEESFPWFEVNRLLYISNYILQSPMQAGTRIIFHFLILVVTEGRHKQELQTRTNQPTNLREGGGLFTWTSTLAMTPCSFSLEENELQWI